MQRATPPRDDQAWIYESAANEVHMTGSFLRFDGRVGIVTGAGRGLGRAYALELVRRGAVVIINDLRGADASELDAVLQECNEIAPSSARGVAGDVSDPAVAAEMVRTAVEQFGGLDFVVNNAGVPLNGSFAKTSYEDLWRTVRIHLGGHFALTAAAWPVMAKRSYGRIVMTGSNAGLLGMADSSGYAASKGAIIALAKSAALEAEGCGITVNVICPSARTKMAVDTMSPDYAAKMREFFPPEAVAPVVAWLVHQSCTVNGAVIDTKGGAVRAEFVAATQGVFLDDISAETVAAAKVQILDRTDPLTPGNVTEASNWFFQKKDKPQPYRPFWRLEEEPALADGGGTP